MTPAMRTGKLLDSYIEGGKTNLLKQNVFQLPVYFFVGKHDYTTSAELAQQYFAVIKAQRNACFCLSAAGTPRVGRSPSFFMRAYCKSRPTTKPINAPAAERPH